MNDGRKTVGVLYLAMNNVGDVAANAIATGEFEAAEAMLTAALATDPGDAMDLRVVLAQCLSKQLRFEEAIALWIRILETPDVPGGARLSAANGLAICAMQSGKPGIVRPYVDRMGFRTSPYPSDRCWRPRILGVAGYVEEAEAELRELLAECPGDPFITYILGSSMMQRGDPAGQLHDLAYSSRAFFRPYYPHTPLLERMWEGEPLEGRSLAIIPHGGYGDYFQFIRHVPQLRRLGVGRIVAVAHSRCHGLILSTGVDAVVDQDEAEEARSACDLWVTTFGLARAGGTSAAPYLRAPPSAGVDAILRSMRARAAGRPCIGLYWHSDMQGGEIKSIPLPPLAPVFARKDIHWVVLQRGFALREMRRAGVGLDATVMGEDMTFDESGALITGLDGVATICAWPFHLAGALGTRTWLLAGRVMDARHMNRERESVLYPGCATLARQPSPGDWPGAIARLMAELDAFILARGLPVPPAPAPC